MTRENMMAAQAPKQLVAEEVTQQMRHAGLNRAFLTAQLLTGNAAQAEHAVMGAIAAWGPGPGERDFMEHVVRTALGPKYENVQPPKDDKPFAEWPAELRAILHLPLPLRHCYVLRVLIGSSREACARVLGLTAQGIDESTTAALHMLPQLMKRPQMAAGCRA